jgi:hypothetical protein
MKTIREDVVGNTTVQLLETANGYVGIVNGPTKQTAPLHGDDPELLWRKLLAEVGKAHPDYFGYDGARSRFLSGFPDGFAGQRYMAGERTYKTDAVAKVAGMLSLETAKCAGRAECVLAARAFQATNLVFQVEKARITDVLKHPSGAAFVKAAARFADGEIGAGFVDMLSAIRDAGQAPSWPMLTYLPFLWRPDRHLFLKPKVTRDFAYRVGHSFARDYEAGLTIEVYESLLDLGTETNREVADLGPRDLIDIQSFIWVVGAYTDVELKKVRED